MQTLKNKAFRVSIQWNALVRKLLSLERGVLTGMDEKNLLMLIQIYFNRRLYHAGFVL